MTEDERQAALTFRAPCHRCSRIALLYRNDLCPSCDVGQRRAARKDRLDAARRRQAQQQARKTG